MDLMIEKFKREEGCKSCGYYKEKEELLQNDENKIIIKVPYCNLFKTKLKNTIPCDKFKLSVEVIRRKMIGH